MTTENQPVSNVVWRDRAELVPNDYNPNRVAPKELQLLQTSILEDGWTQPIVVLEDGSIVDGFHRWTVAGTPELMERFGGQVPTVVVKLDPVHRKMSTIRHNRARGRHGVQPMADIVRSMVEEGLERAEVMDRLQMDRVEFERLLDIGTMPDSIPDDANFSPAWEPEFS